MANPAGVLPFRTKVEGIEQRERQRQRWPLIRESGREFGYEGAGHLRARSRCRQLVAVFRRYAWGLVTSQSTSRR